MLTPDTLKDYIAAGLPCTYLSVDGDGQHFYATIVSEEFRGLSMIKQHQRVYAALGDRMKAEVHALSMKTYSPEQWAAQSEQGANNG
jgi:acid stress-induced BolA-like protein IbaG/YrbA